MCPYMCMYVNPPLYVCLVASLGILGVCIRRSPMNVSAYFMLLQMQMKRKSFCAKRELMKMTLWMGAIRATGMVKCIDVKMEFAHTCIWI
jgi:hypothetical protein